MIKIVYPYDCDPQYADIYLTKGDTLKASLTLAISKTEEYTPVEGDAIRFAVKKKYSDSATVVNVTVPNDTMILTVPATTTDDLRVGRYVFDMQITYADGTVDTFLSGNLIITEEVI